MHVTWPIHARAWTIHECDMTHSCVWHDSFMRVTWLIYACDMTHSCVWHDSVTSATWLINKCDMIHLRLWHDLRLWHGSFIGVTWPVHEWHDPHVYMSIMTHICIYLHIYDSFMCVYSYIYDSIIYAMTHPYVPWLIHMSVQCVIRLNNVWYDAFIPRIYTCATTHSYGPWLIHMCHDSFICAMTHSYVPWLIHMSVQCVIRRNNVWYDAFIQGGVES